MTNRGVFPFLILVAAISTGQTVLYAQDKNQQAGNRFHNQKYFLKKEQARLSQVLLAFSTRQEKEKNIVNRLLAKNDSLGKSGNIYDSVAVDIEKQLTAHQHRIDSISNIIKDLGERINSTSVFRKQYAVLQPAVSSIDYWMKETSPRNDSIYHAIDIQFDTSNLSGEKGKLKSMLKSAAVQLEKEGAKTGQIGDAKETILKSGSIEESVSGKIDDRLRAYQQRMDSISGEIKVLGEKLDSPKEFTRDFRIIKAKIILIDSVVNKGAAAREYIFQMIDEGLVKSTRNLFELAAFFGPGGFIVPESKYKMAGRFFSPVIDSLVKFSNNYSSLLRTVSIVVHGYSDASGISPGSKLYDTLTAYINKKPAEKNELNAALSALRAEEISRVLNKLLKKRYPDLKSIDKIVFEAIEIGQGENLPDQAIKNYRVSDERRRVVIIYWSVLPI